MSRRAFTLVELLVVISIIGLLSSIAVVSMGSSREKARMAAGKQYAASVDHAVGDQIVGRWDFDECSGTAANDTSGSGNNGTFVGSPAWSTNTPSGQGCSLNFTSAANYVDVPDSNLLDLSDNFTVSIWAYPNSGSSGAIYMLKGDDSVGGMAPAYGFAGFGFEMIANNVSASPHSAARADDFGRWHQIVGTVAGGTRSLYVDGHFVASQYTAVGNSWNNSNHLFIGRGAGASAFALLDEVRVYAGALTAMQVQKLYAEESRKFKVAMGTIDE